MTIKGVVQNGVVVPSADIAAYDGQEVEITLPNGSAEEGQSSPEADEVEGLTELINLIERISLDIGVPDFAHEHDHYIHGSPKRSKPH